MTFWPPPDQRGRLSFSRPLAGLAVVIAVAAGCGRCGHSSPAVAKFDGGVVTEEELRRDVEKLPPILRTRFEGGAGRRELIAAIVDKRLLAREARERKLDEAPEIRREVQELEERLVIQALLAAEEKGAGEPPEAELRAWYDGHRAELGEPERARARRILAAAPAGASDADRERARAKAARFAARLQAGERFEKVAADGEGAERAHGGDLGLIARTDAGDPGLVAAVFALSQPGARSPVVAVAGGFAVVELVERRPARTPTFEEARGEVGNRILPERKRRAFDQLLGRLRGKAGVRIEP